MSLWTKVRRSMRSRSVWLTILFGFIFIVNFLQLAALDHQAKQEEIGRRSSGDKDEEKLFDHVYIRVPRENLEDKDGNRKRSDKVDNGKKQEEINEDQEGNNYNHDVDDADYLNNYDLGEEEEEEGEEEENDDDDDNDDDDVEKEEEEEEEELERDNKDEATNDQVKKLDNDKKKENEELGKRRNDDRDTEEIEDDNESSDTQEKPKRKQLKENKATLNKDHENENIMLIQGKLISENNEGQDIMRRLRDAAREAKQEKDIKKESKYDGYYNINETLNGRPVIKVLLLAYQRAGSSFSGELFTAADNWTMYVYEPLFVWRKLLGPGADPAIEEDSARVLGDLLDCKPKIVREWSWKGFHYFRRMPQIAKKNYCRASHQRLVKTIRARWHFVHPWISRRPDIKIVHLVRDPRGILSSVRRGKAYWSENNRNAELQCSYIQRDLALEALGPNRYLRVRYEDLVDNPLAETKRVYNFMGVKFTEEVMKYLLAHTGLGESETTLKQGYMNTFRGSEFRHDHWKSQLPNREREFIEHVCQGVMATLGYERLPPA